MRDFDIDELKQMATQFIPRPLPDDFLNRRYDWQKTGNHVEWPYYRFFYYLAKWLEPDLVLELGTYQGTAAAHFAGGYDKSIVITVDHHSDPGDDDNQLKVLEAQDDFPNLIYYQGWTSPRIASEQKGKHARGDMGDVYESIASKTLYYGRGIDILFIDSWHCYEYAKLDFETYKPLLSSPALVICDDIRAGGGPESPIQGMLEFWDELPEPKFLNANLHPGTNLGFVKYG